MHITDKDKSRIRYFYAGLLAQNGKYSPQSLNWNNEFTQYTRFKVLADIGDLSNHSVLDVGCGLGDFYFYLATRFKDVLYYGIDIVPEMTGEAIRKYPKAQFENIDILDYKGGKKDYVFASGAFSFKIKNHKKIYFQAIQKMYNISIRGVAFNMLDKSKHIDDLTYAAYDILEVETFCKTFCKEVKIIRGYLPNDFTVYIYKNQNN
jgi:trans-aconitate methyltransferase